MGHGGSTKQKPATAGVATEPRQCVPTLVQVRARAHEIYQLRHRSGVCGDAMTDWIVAESQLRASSNGSAHVGAEWDADESA